MSRLLWPILANLAALICLVTASIGMILEHGEWVWFVLAGVLLIQIPRFTPDEEDDHEPRP